MVYRREVDNKTELNRLYEIVDNFPELKRSELCWQPTFEDMFGRVFPIPPFGPVRDEWIRGINRKTTRAGIDDQIEQARERGNPCFVVEFMDHAGVGGRFVFSFADCPKPTYWEVRWLNPNNEQVPGEMLEWKRVELRVHHQGDIDNAVEELRAYRGVDGKRLYQLRRVYCEYVEETID